MHQETLTSLHLSHQQTQQSLAKIERAIEHHGSVLQSISRQVLSTENPWRDGAATAEVEVDAEHSDENDTGLQLMKESFEVARSFADGISSRGSVVQRSSSHGVTQLRSNERMTNEGPEERQGSGETFLTPQDSASNIEPSTVSREDLAPAHDIFSGDLRIMQTEHSVDFRDKNASNGQADVKNFPPELITHLMENYISAAETNLQDHEYHETMRNLDRANVEGERRESIHRHPFEEKLSIKILRATAHIGLGQLATAESLLRALIPQTAKDSQMQGKAYYLLAKTHRAQYCRANDATTLEQLDKVARQSYSIALHSYAIPKLYLDESAQIMVDVYEWKGDPVGAHLFRERHPSLSLTAAPATAGVDDSTSEQAKETLAKSMRGRLYSSGSQASRSPPSLLTVETQSSTDSWDRRTSVGSEPTTAPTSVLQHTTSVNLLTRIENDDVEMVKYLLRKGADIEQLDEETGFTPLLTAAKLKRTEICQVLLTNNPLKADVRAKSKDGRSVLHIALSRSGGEDMIPLLLQHKADPNVADEGGKTPLHYCAENNKKSAAQHLLKVNADMEAVTNGNESALQIAMRRRTRDIVDVLLKAGAEIDTARLPPTSQDINYIIKRHLGQLSRPRPQSGVTRQNSASTAISGSTARTEGSILSRFRSHRIS